MSTMMISFHALLSYVKHLLSAFCYCCCFVYFICYCCWFFFSLSYSIVSFCIDWVNLSNIEKSFVKQNPPADFPCHYGNLIEIQKYVVWVSTRFNICFLVIVQYVNWIAWFVLYLRQANDIWGFVWQLQESVCFDRV